VNRKAPHTARRVAPLLALLLLIVAGCGVAGSNKIGATSRRAVVLRMANINGGPRELQTFADEVASRSHGALRIEFINGWRWGQRDAEEQLIGDLRTGKAELAAIPSRAWDAAGVTSFDALQAPFLIDSYALEQAVLESDIPNKMLRGVSPLGLVGLGVLPGPLRYPLSAPRPLRTPADFAGLRVGYHGANEPAETLRALGAKPVQLQSGAPWQGMDAIEQQLASIYGNNYDTFANYLTANVTFWPRPWVIVINKKTFASLSPSQRTVLHEAANKAIPATISAVRAQDRTALANLCQRHLIKFVTATPNDLATLNAAVTPVLAGVERNPQTQSFIATIKAIRNRAGTTPEAPPSCTPHTAPAASGLPNGSYTTRITLDDVRRSGLLGTPGLGPSDTRDLTQSHFTLIFRSGNFVAYQLHPNGQREIGIGGTYSLYRDRFIGTGSNGDVIRARWSVHGTTLRFTEVQPRGPYSVVWGSEPWTRRSP
jgi:TRAP-type C4-dicarboxylate transport system substrate-binding protein